MFSFLLIRGFFEDLFKIYLDGCENNLGRQILGLPAAMSKIYTSEVVTFDSFLTDFSLE